ncbi:MAG: endonuclease V [Candidatus Thermoplasmatota archaeon]|nr:endonuclease V [Candidatus Thermoplasmatota archaeon]
MDLYQYTYNLVEQIPDGRVSTYGAVAKALGDIRASRAVGRMMNQNPHPDKMPCYRIVYRDGGIGGFAPGKDEKIKRLKKDNIQVEQDKIINFESLFFDDFKTTYPLKKYRKKQLLLRKKLTIKDQIDKSEISTIAGFDVAYPKNDFDNACSAAVVIDYKSKAIIETKTLFQQTRFPYIPTYLTFRETPIIQKVYQTLKTKPSVLMFDGNGILHPFHFGLASHAGVLLNQPSIGIAKSLLCGTQRKNNTIEYNDEIIGKALYAHNNVKKPVYVSSGNMITLSTAYKIALELSKYKHPKPVRQAHILATTTLKEQLS